MNKLHSSHGNLRSWKFYDSRGLKVLRFDAGWNIVKSVATIIFIITVGLVVYPIVKDKAPPPVQILLIVALTAAPILVAAVGFYIHTKEKKEKDLFTYCPPSGEATFPRIDQTVPNALEELSFSNERHHAVKGTCHELNYVLNGSRHPLISHTHSQRKIARQLEEMGFKVSVYDAIKESS